MAQVSIVVKIFPEDMDKLDEVRQAVERELKPVQMGVAEVAFGAKVLLARLVVNDEEGGDIEEKVKKVPGVSEVSVESVDRL
ncbi:hypothetical protein HY992_01890 [Candidatus Micrarchaeota archaeon]|nr:hypothetical protein [Candidatus Micrarchaeota archaeon]